MRKYGILLCAIGMFFWTCTASTVMTIRKNGGGDCSVSIRLAPPFVDYITDMMMVSGLDPIGMENGFFDPKAIRDMLADFPGISVGHIRTPEKGGLDLSFSFTSLNALVRAHPELKNSGIMAFYDGPEKSVVIRLGRNTVSRLFTAILPDNAFEFGYLLPQEGETRDEYHANLDFALDDGALLFRESVLTFSITVEGTVIRHNGVTRGASTVFFELSLDDLFFPASPVEYYIVFR